MALLLFDAQLSSSLPQYNIIYGGSGAMPIDELLFHFHIKAPSSLARLRFLNILFVSFRRLNPHRLECISDLKLELGAYSFPSCLAYLVNQAPEDRLPGNARS
jgi:hypothetical protein